MSTSESSVVKTLQHSLATSVRARRVLRFGAVGIVMPAGNDETTISGCVDALYGAQHHIGWHNALWIVIVVDSSTDRTSRRAREALGAFGAVIEIDARSSRVCHQLGEAAVRRHFETMPRHALLLTSTNAVTAVPADWLEKRVTSASLLSPSSGPRIDVP